MIRHRILGAALAAMLAGCAGAPQKLRIIPQAALTSVAGGDLGILQPPPAAALAYFDRSAGKIYVDASRRQEVINFMRARVRGNRWAFQWKRQQDDSPKQEEAEEQEYRQWDPTQDPAKGDIRVVDEECVNITFTLNCVLVAGTGKWAKGDPITVGQCSGDRERLCWEVFGVIGTATLYSDKECTKRVGTANVVNWSCLQE